MPPVATATVIGGGPGGLMAAEVLADAGVQVTVYEHMASVGRKLLLAGRSGLNITHHEPLSDLIDRFGAAGGRLAPALTAFGPEHVRAWVAGLGEDTFVGSSGRVFPASFRATPLLRAWLARLERRGVVIETRARWIGGDGGRSIIQRADGSTIEVASDVTVLALGGGSWPRVGSDGGWVATLRDAGIVVHDLRAANVGLLVAWGSDFAERHAGSPLKNVSLNVAGRPDDPVRGDVMITSQGLEGGPIYAVSSAVRDIVERDGRATIVVDVHPDLDLEQVVERLGRRRPKDSTSTVLRRTLGLSATTIAWLREIVGGPLPASDADLATLVKAVPVQISGAASLDRAISSAGGVDLGEVDEVFMLRRQPGVFVVGEMLDWDAPTGGYLLQATLSTAVAAARGALDWLQAEGVLPVYDEIDAGDTVWRFDRRFLGSHWTCIWGSGCKGIGAEPAPELGHGCCSLGAELDGPEEALNLSALADTLEPAVFQHHAEATRSGVFRDGAADATRVVDGACIFLNRRGFVGGEGCALHLAAVQAGEPPLEWKPSVCWQLPLKVDWEMRGDVEVATVRGWERRDWGNHGATMAWCCTEEPEAYRGHERVVESLADELTEIVGTEVFVELRRRWS